MPWNYFVKLEYLSHLAKKKRERRLNPATNRQEQNNLYNETNLSLAFYLASFIRWYFNSIRKIYSQISWLIIYINISSFTVHEKKYVTSAITHSICVFCSSFVSQIFIIFINIIPLTIRGRSGNIGHLRKILCNNFRIITN